LIAVKMGAEMPPFFMAITITTIHPPATKAPIAWDWQAAQDDDPKAQVALATLAAGLKTGTVGTAGTYTDPPAYTVTGVKGLFGAGGAAANGDMSKSAPTPAPPVGP
jgi:hypothetical protein